MVLLNHEHQQQRITKLAGLTRLRVAGNTLLPECSSKAGEKRQISDHLDGIEKRKEEKIKCKGRQVQIRYLGDA